jgi:2Fe-2S ferredoxin
MIMVDPKYDIEFTICYLNKEYRLKSCKNACGNLRDLIIQKVGAEDFGQCGGMGRCATCIVQVQSAYEQIIVLKKMSP